MFLFYKNSDLFSCFSWISWTPVFEVLLTASKKNQGASGPVGTCAGFYGGIAGFFY